MIDGPVERTLARPTSVSGVGLHSGAPVTARLSPAAEGAGVTFTRVDLLGRPSLAATLDAVVSTARSVVLGGSARISTVEHLLSAARGMGVDNLAVELDGEELPCGDGSAQVFVDAFARVGIVKQQALRRPIVLQSAVWVTNGSSIIVAVPAASLSVTYVATADGAALAPQIAEFRDGVDEYAHAVAPARTWGLATEVDALRARGLARGASLATTLVIGPDGFVNEPRFPDELARHKILDAIGDLALLGRPLCAHVVAVRAGHGLHVALAREIAVRVGLGEREEHRARS